jgi:polyisoprenoid-binding protein YceI
MLKKIILAVFLLSAFPALAAAPKWIVVPEKSKIAFRGTQMGGDFAGVFKAFTPEIYFDPEQLDQSRVTVTVDVTSGDSGDGERDAAMKSKDWFDVKQFPAAHFKSTAFAKTEADAYTVTGNLTIRDVTVPVTLPFKLILSADSGKQTAEMTGQVTLDRSAFKLGQGEWADPSSVGNDVVVDITLSAIRE